MAKIKMQNNDWEAVIGVLNGVSASKQTMLEIANIENVSVHVLSALAEVLEEEKKLYSKQDKLMDAMNSEFAAVRARNIGTPESPEMLQFKNRVQLQLDREVFEPLNRLGIKETELEIEDAQLESVRKSFAQHAFFGEKGYNDTMSGKASYGRALKALGIKPEEVSNSQAVPEEVPTQDAPSTVEANIDPPEVKIGS